MVEAAKIAIIDDDDSLVRALQIALRARGHRVVTAGAATTGVELVALEQPDVVILDLGLPDRSGLLVVRELRSFTACAILVLSAAGDEDMKIRALDDGADDYLTKPFSMRELEARLRVALRHRSGQGAPAMLERISTDRLDIDLAGRRVMVDQAEVELSHKEFELLAFLARNAGRVCTHQMILREVWGPGYATELHYLRVYANRLRRKLDDPDGEVLRTSPGVGYQLVI
jgi:two-component system KDP operon response regulator KdpE